ncbi:MAG: nucleotidyltransferase family protein [Gemmataceae bacterium]|nr:nucleotidyltransferase family protein [Gemmataceae bacterium]
MARTFGLVPAAGKSVRMGRPKLLLEWRGKPILAHVLEALSLGGVETTLVVVRPGDTELRDAAENAGADVLMLPAETPDMKATILAGLDELQSTKIPSDDDGFLLVPADHPTLDAEIVRTLLAESAGGSTVVPTCNGKRGHPTWIAWRHVSHLHRLGADEGLNTYLRRHADGIREIDWPNGEILRDLDTPADFERLLRDGL